MYLVISGSARFELEGDSVPAPQGTCVHVVAGVMRTAFAEEAGTTILAVSGGLKGEPYRASGWEVWAPLRSLMQAGRHEELVARAQPLLDQGAAYPELLTTWRAARVCLEAALRDEPAFAELSGG